MVILFLLYERRVSDGSLPYSVIILASKPNLVNETDTRHIKTPQIVAFCNYTTMRIKELQGKYCTSLLIYQLPLIYRSLPYSSDVSFYSVRWIQGWIFIARKGSVNCCFLWVICQQLKSGTVAIGFWLHHTDFSRTVLRQFALSSPPDIQGWQACKIYFAILNLKNRYWQFRLDEDSSELCSSLYPGADICFLICLLK